MQGKSGSAGLTLYDNIKKLLEKKEKTPHEIEQERKAQELITKILSGEEVGQMEPGSAEWVIFDNIKKLNELLKK